MADTTTQQQIVREAPEIEAYKLGLLELAKNTASNPITLPEYRIAGFSPEQEQAFKIAQMGVGAYLPYLNRAGSLYEQAGGMYAGLPQYGANAIQAVSAGAERAMGYGSQGVAAAGAAGSAAKAAGSKAVESIDEAAKRATDAGFAGAKMYDVKDVYSYMNPYQELATQATLREIARQGNIMDDTLNAQAVRQGAYGGSRQGIQQSELQRNVLDQMSRTVAADNANNYNQAQQAAMNAFQNQQARMQQAGNLALGAGQAQANTNISSGQLSLGAGQLETNAAMNAGLMSLNAGQAIGQANVSAGQLQQAGAAGIGSLGQQTANLGQMSSGLAQGDASFLYNLGSQAQGLQQRQYDADRAYALQSQYEPYQRISFLSDIYKGAPSSSNTIAQSTAPTPSLTSQLVGGGTAALAAYNLATR